MWKYMRYWGGWKSKWPYYMLIIGACPQLGAQWGLSAKSLFSKWCSLHVCLCFLTAWWMGFQKSIVSSKARSCVDLLRPCRRGYTVSLPKHFIGQNRSEDTLMFKERGNRPHLLRKMIRLCYKKLCWMGDTAMAIFGSTVYYSGLKSFGILFYFWPWVWKATDTSFLIITFHILKESFGENYYYLLFCSVSQGIFD